MKRKLPGIIIASLLALFGIFMIVFALMGGKDLLPITDFTADDLGDEYDYFIEEAFILDHYASYELNGNDVAYYIAVGFYDEADTLCLVSMELEKEDKIYQKIADYLEDDSMYLGDLALTMYVSSTRFDADSDLGVLLGQYSQELEGIDIENHPLWLQLDYMGSNRAEYDDAASAGRMSKLILAACFMVMAVLVLVLTLFAKKKTPTVSSPEPAYIPYPAAPPESQPAPGYMPQPAPQPTPGYAPQPTPGYAPQPASQPPVQQTPPQREQGFCTVCGSPTKPGAAFCAKCGSKLK